MKVEQWKSGGDCRICRRRKYCTKTCSAYEKALKRDIATAVIKRMAMIRSDNE